MRHAGGEKLYNHMLNKGYYWIGMRSDITEVLKTYDYCQKFKKDNQIRHPPMIITDIANDKFEKIAIDLVDMRTIRTVKQNKYILSIQDNLTKFIYLHTLKNKEATFVVTHLIHFVSLFGIPKVMLSNTGKEFDNELMTLLMEVFNIDHIFITPYHPQSNGSLEGMHGKL